MLRRLSWIFLSAAAMLLLLAPASTAQIPYQGQYNKGQDIVPVYEGFVPNPDGTFTMYFGYFNRNYQEELDIPVGTDNNIEPGGDDRGQPTHFYPRRQLYVFRVTVPNDWGSEKRMVWTLKIRGKVNTAKGWLGPDWLINQEVMMENAGGGNDEENEPPALTGSGPQTISLPDTVMLTATAQDDGRPKPRRQRNLDEGSAPSLGLSVRWIQYSGPGPPLPSARTLAAETEPVSTDVEVLTADHPGSDFMLDVIKSLGFEYIAANPGSSFRALHESIVNYGGNKSPELLTCCHEESSVFIADGYARVEGKPMGVMAHSTVGLQHASMGIYNSFAGRVPVFIILGNTIDAAARRPGVEWYHSAQDAAAMVRDYTKWDDLPISLTHFAESAVRGYKIAMTPPGGPVVLVADSDLQETPVADLSRLHIPKLTLASPPAGDPVAVAELAKLLVAAENP